ncbi:MAG: DUF4097 family beta strand repeat-containing protein [bacterium]
MKKFGSITMTAILVVVLMTAAQAGSDRTTNWTFEKKERIKISTVSGDCVVMKGKTDQIEVEVINSYSPRDSFKPKVRERKNTLRLSENILGSNNGSATWTLTVPDGTEIEFSSASGDLIIENLSGDFSSETASGDVEVLGCTGGFYFNTASGTIEIEDCSGEFVIATASGDVDAVNVVLREAGSFATASGKVEVALAETADHDLTLSSASGRVLLDYNGNPIKGFFEFTARDRKGRIDSPFDFDNEETFRKWGEKYVAKTFTKDGDSPQIALETASGRASLRQ